MTYSWLTKPLWALFGLDICLSPVSWLATVVFAFAIGSIVSAMGAGSLVGLLVTTALVVVIKSYWVMPFLARKLSRWLNR